MAGEKQTGLRKNLTLFDVYAICTGAMFSSGFFLLPGIAFARTGSSVVIAYLLAGFLVIPAMLSKAELATAMPRAGGTYFYLDRCFGPIVGTVGGLGIWLAMVLKTAFALVGIGVYLSLVIELDSGFLSLILVATFLVLNLVGAKEAGYVQRFLVLVLLVIMSVFIGEGMWVAVSVDAPHASPEFLSNGMAGLMSTVGLVFVSYAGLTKVASVAEEVRNPDRNIPLGMGLSLLTSTLVYSLGAYVLLALLDPADLARPDLTPVASAAEQLFTWLPPSYGLILIVAASFGAFASTGNAALLSASRYLLALGRDNRVPSSFARINRLGTPTLALCLSAGAVTLSLLTLDVENVAKLASAFQLMIFATINLALIVMRESQIKSYDPGFRSPLYPGVQIFGLVTPFFLIAEMGHTAVLFSFALVAAGVLWYFVYARSRDTSNSSGAIYYVFANLLKKHREAVGRLQEGLEGELEQDGLDLELLAIIGERGLRDQDPYDEVVARGLILEMSPGQDYRHITSVVASRVAERVGVPEAILAEELLEAEVIQPQKQGVALRHISLEGMQKAQLVLVRCGGVCPGHESEAGPCGIVFLISSDSDPGEHLRLLTHLALRVEREGFRDEWLRAAEPQQLLETLLHHQRFLSLTLDPGGPAAELIGHPVRELELPESTLLAAVRRKGEVIFPRGDTTLLDWDRVTIVGPEEAIGLLSGKWARDGHQNPPSSSD
jgi:APA family basic amino acid/polyamine antiporter